MIIFRIEWQKLLVIFNKIFTYLNHIYLRYLGKLLHHNPLTLYQVLDSVSHEHVELDFCKTLFDFEKHNFRKLQSMGWKQSKDSSCLQLKGQL